ncbi:ANR31 protein, partial [Rhinopomastus cyanomelas]|nr:ANR31 protein [Rhinopomastus cyanomelas]
RASVESFKNGALRKQLANLASKQKSLVAVTENQEKLIQKIQTYRKNQEMFSASYSEKQIANLVISHGNDKRQSLSTNEIICPDVVTFNVGRAANKPDGNGVEAHLSLENGSSTQEYSQYPHICMDEMGANKEAIRSKEVSDHALVSDNNMREYPFNMSKLTNAVKVLTLPSEPAVSNTTTQSSQEKYPDCVAIAEQINKSLNPSSITNALNTVEPQSPAVTNSVCQQGSESQKFHATEDLHWCLHKTDDLQQQEQVVLSTSTKNFPNTLQEINFQSSKNSCSASSVLVDIISNAHYPVNVNQKSSQRYSNEECEKNQVRGRRDKKKLQLIDLLQLGRIKPGENVLEFKLQEFSCKATVLKNGKIRTSKRQILQNPVQWIKELLGSDISVTWKYVWNKVTYLGTPLSDFVVEEVSVSRDLELPLQK